MLDAFRGDLQVESSMKTPDLNPAGSRESGPAMPVSRRGAIAGMSVLGLSGLAQGAAAAKSSEPPTHPLARRLAVYADALRFEDLDAATIERVKTHVIDSIGCGIGAFDEKPVRICRDVALA